MAMVGIALGLTACQASPPVIAGLPRLSAFALERVATDDKGDVLVAAVPRTAPAVSSELAFGGARSLPNHERGPVGPSEADAAIIAPVVVPPADGTGINTPATSSGGRGGGSYSYPATPAAPVLADPLAGGEPEVPSEPGEGLALPALDLPSSGRRPDGFLALPGGGTIAMYDADEFSLPRGVAGELGLFIFGRVPATIVWPGQVGNTLVVHPRSEVLVGLQEGVGALAGSLAPAEAGLTVFFTGHGLRSFAGTTTDAAGQFAFGATLSGPTSGLVVARGPGDAPRLAIARTTVTPGGTVIVPPLTLVAAAPPAAVPPLAPPGLEVRSASLVCLDGTGDEDRWPLTVFAVNGAELPYYAFPGFRLQTAFQAMAPVGGLGSETRGPAGDVPAFLVPPDLAALPSRLSAGQRLDWPAVHGATLYTLTLGSRAMPDPPLWEGATIGPAITLPAALDLDHRDLVLSVTAWDAKDVTLYSVVSARQLRVPQDSREERGRRSWALRTYTP